MSTVELNNNIFQISNNLRVFALKLTNNQEDANDLYQETAYRAIKNKDRFKEGTNFKAWIFTIMKNIFINDYRKKVRANTVFDASPNLVYINSGKTVIANSGDSNILLDELTTMLNSLDNNIRIPFLMHYQGFKYQEIADQLDLPLGTVKSRIFFARRELKAMIKRQYQNDLR